MTEQTPDAFVGLPAMPDRIAPRNTARALKTLLRNYVYTLYNGRDGQFKRLWASVDNDTSVTGNRMFDRNEAVKLVIKAATDQRDMIVAGAKQGVIYRHLVQILNENPDLKLQVRRAEYRRIQHQPAAAE